MSPRNRSVLGLTGAILYFCLHGRKTEPQLPTPARHSSLSPRASNARAPAELPPAPKVATAAQAPLALDTRAFADELAKLKACFEGSCNLPDGDAHEYSFAVGQSLKGKLVQMTHWVRSERVEESPVSEVAREYLAIDDGHVQEAALALMATQPPQPENLAAILEHILGGYDADLIAPALEQLQLYTSFTERDRIDQAFGEALTTGAPFLAQQVLVHLPAFLTARNREFYVDLAEQLPDGSVYRLQLTQLLR